MLEVMCGILWVALAALGALAVVFAIAVVLEAVDRHMRSGPW